VDSSLNPPITQLPDYSIPQSTIAL
jgi:hypothetical protein